MHQPFGVMNKSIRQIVRNVGILNYNSNTMPHIPNLGGETGYALALGCKNTLLVISVFSYSPNLISNYYS